MPKEIAYLKNASHIFADGTKIDIGGFSLNIFESQKVVLLGPNGSGKTSLLLLLIGLLRNDGKVVRLFGKDPKRDFDKIKKKIGVVFQNIEAQLIAPTVEEDIGFTPRNFGLDEEEVQKVVNKSLVLIGIEHLKGKIIHYLSGGEKKKVALAGAMVMSPSLLILDEPFEGLDPRARQELIATLELFNDLYGTTVFLSTHDVETAIRFADQVYIMIDGNLILKGEPIDIFNKIKELKKANLHAPGLLELSYYLNKSGYKITPSIDVEMVKKQLIKELTKTK